MNPVSIEARTGPRPAAELLLTLSATAEIGVGLVVALLPIEAMQLLLGAPLDAAGAAAARVMGVAAAALGVAWWPDRRRLDPHRMRQVAAGFVAYNLGAGLAFLAYALTVDRPPLMPWLVAAVHLLAGGTFAVLASRDSTKSVTGRVTL